MVIDLLYYDTEFFRNTDGPANSMSVSIWLNRELIATAILGILLFKEHLGRFATMGILPTLIGIFPNGISIFLYVTSAQNFGATGSQVLFSTSPFGGIILAHFLLGEKIVYSIVSAIFFTQIRAYSLPGHAPSTPLCKRHAIKR